MAHHVIVVHAEAFEDWRWWPTRWGCTSWSCDSDCRYAWAVAELARVQECAAKP